MMPFLTPAQQKERLENQRLGIAAAAYASQFIGTVKTVDELVIKVQEITGENWAATTFAALLLADAIRKCQPGAQS